MGGIEWEGGGGGGGVLKSEVNLDLDEGPQIFLLPALPICENVEIFIRIFTRKFVWNRDREILFLFYRNESLPIIYAF